jgi:phosphoribosylformylglycinamidine cyclo-ligase
MAQEKPTACENLTYRSAGVDIDANDRMVDAIQTSLRRTHDPRVLWRGDSFAGLFCLDYSQKLLRRNYREPVLVAGTDGVGSKLLLGLEAGRVSDLGIDLVAMSVNDVLVMGAEPLFFLDYVACHKLKPEWVAKIVDGVARGCTQAGCSLLGGETAEMPDLYAPEHFDLAGFCVGVVEKRRIIDGRDVEPGDVVLGLASDGVHSNGFALVRRLLERLPDKEPLPPSVAKPPIATRGEFIERLLCPTRIYTKPVLQVLKRYRRKRVVRAMAHITGGGLEGNVPRVVPTNCDVCVSRTAWTVPAVFQVLQRIGVEEEEMYRVFNMGIGFVLVVRPAFAESVAEQLTRLGETVFQIGSIREGTGKLVMER